MLYQTGVYFIIALKARGHFVFKSPCEAQATPPNTWCFEKEYHQEIMSNNLHGRLYEPELYLLVCVLLCAMILTI